MNVINEKQALKELEKSCKKAVDILKNDQRVEDFLRQVEAKLRTIPKIGDELAMIPIMASLIRSFVRGEYQQIPSGTIIAATGALIYFLSAVDLIPDLIAGLGYLDDISVIGVCIKLIKSDVDDYLEWRNKHDEMMKKKTLKK